MWLCVCMSRGVLSSKHMVSRMGWDGMGGWDRERDEGKGGKGGG